MSLDISEFDASLSFPFQRLRSLLSPILRYGVSIPAAADLSGVWGRTVIVAFRLIEMMTRFTEPFRGPMFGVML